MRKDFRLTGIISAIDEGGQCIAQHGEQGEAYWPTSVGNQAAESKQYFIPRMIDGSTTEQGSRLQAWGHTAVPKNPEGRIPKGEGDVGVETLAPNDRYEHGEKTSRVWRSPMKCNLVEIGAGFPSHAMGFRAVEICSLHAVRMFRTDETLCIRTEWWFDRDGGWPPTTNPCQ
ncbi:hypothetical protein LZ31DRAFT_253149 [Colletotrichum somersetense]|nr:hypothetical protein LZ31DRAFT_253149 [Colletotrichum somersetense]